MTKRYFIMTQWYFSCDILIFGFSMLKTCWKVLKTMLKSCRKPLLRQFDSVNIHGIAWFLSLKSPLLRLFDSNRHLYRDILIVTLSPIKSQVRAYCDKLIYAPEHVGVTQIRIFMRSVSVYCDCLIVRFEALTKVLSWHFDSRKICDRSQTACLNSLIMTFW